MFLVANVFSVSKTELLMIGPENTELSLVYINKWTKQDVFFPKPYDNIVPILYSRWNHIKILRGQYIMLT